MTCNQKAEEINQPADCKCYPAVLRTYKGMSDEPEHIALEAALRVYQFHHPEDPKDKARLTVESWVYSGHSH